MIGWRLWYFCKIMDRLQTLEALCTWSSWISLSRADINLIGTHLGKSDLGTYLGTPIGTPTTLMSERYDDYDLGTAEVQRTYQVAHHLISCHCTLLSWDGKSWSLIRHNYLHIRLSQRRAKSSLDHFIYQDVPTVVSTSRFLCKQNFTTDPVWLLFIFPETG